MMRSLFALALAAALPLSAHAAEGPDGLSFTDFEADYVQGDVDAFDSMDGFGVRGSAHFSDNWYATGSWTRVSEGDVDLGYLLPVDIDFEQTVLGIGWHGNISDRAAFLVEGSYVHDTFESEINSIPAGGNNGIDGWRLTAGLRGQLGERFEGEVRAHWTDMQDVDSGFGGEINGLFHVNKTWGITGGWSHDDLGDFDVDQWHLGVRASFY
jgi:hypothetical protein